MEIRLWGMVSELEAAAEPPEKLLGSGSMGLSPEFLTWWVWGGAPSLHVNEAQAMLLVVVQGPRSGNNWPTGKEFELWNHLHADVVY